MHGFKPLIRAIGFDDGHFMPRSRGTTKLVGVVCRADGQVAGMVSTDIEIDGLDATDKLVHALEKSRFHRQAKIVFLSGVNFAGFNVVDARQLHRRLNRPVVIVFKRQPKLPQIRDALAALPDGEKRLAFLENAGPIHRGSGFRFQCIGIPRDEAGRLIKRFCVHSSLPEPVRLAHLIASGVTLGESTRP